MPRKYRPQIKVYEHERPSHAEYVRAILSDEMLYQSTMRPGKRDNIRWLTLRPEDNIDDPGLPGNESTYSTYRPPVLILNNDIRWKSTYNVGHWTYQPSPQEQDWRNLQLLEYNSQLYYLEQIQTKSDDDLAQIVTLKNLLAQLGVKGEGYLETAYNLLGSQSSGITWGLAVANIPVTVTSTFLSQKNRGQSFRLKRLEAPEGQVRHEFTLEIGNGNSLYALVIGEDGNSSSFIHYRNMKVSERALLITELNSLEDTGRLTVEDRGNILLWEQDIKRTQYDAKKAGRTAKDYTDAENNRIESLKKRIEDLKESKRGLTQADQERKGEIEKQLYLEKEEFALMEHSKEMIGKTIDFTFHFLRAGYVVIQTEDGRKIYENRRLTGGVPAGTEPQFGDSLPPNAYMTIKSDGGMWSIVYGNPRYDSRGIVWTQPFEIPFDFDASEIEWLLEADAQNPGCRIECKLLVVRAPKTLGIFRIPGIYQIQITLDSFFDIPRNRWGRYTPELYYVEMHIPAAVLTDTPTVVWDSEAAENMWPGIDKSRLIDLLMQDDKNRSRMCTAVIGNGQNEANLPVLLGGKACDIKLKNIEDDSIINVMTYGFLGRVAKGDHKTFEAFETDKIKVTTAPGNHTNLEITGCEGFLDKEMNHPLTGNNKYVGDYVRQMARDAGLPLSLYQNLPVGNAGGCPRIKRMKPGCFPDVKPSEGIRFWEYMQYIVKEHAPRWEIWVDENGLRLTLTEERLRTDIQFSTTADIDSPQRLRRQSNEGAGLELHQDLRDYWTSATFIGAVNPLNGMRYIQTERIPQATDDQFKDSMFYVGVENHYTAPTDESLKSEADCRSAARQFLNITRLTKDGLTPWTLNGTIDLDTTVKGGDIILINGLRFIIEGTEFLALNAGTRKDQQMSLMMRLAEDRKLENPDGN